jgi:hypothetical protein
MGATLKEEKFGPKMNKDEAREYCDIKTFIAFNLHRKLSRDQVIEDEISEAFGTEK